MGNVLEKTSGCRAKMKLLSEVLKEQLIYYKHAVLNMTYRFLKTQKMWWKVTSRHHCLY